MATLIERLRDFAATNHVDGIAPHVCEEAAAEIERLQQYPSVIASMKQGSFTDARVCEDIERRVKEGNAVAVHKAAATPDEEDG